MTSASISIIVVDKTLAQYSEEFSSEEKYRTHTINPESTPNQIIEHDLALPLHISRRVPLSNRWREPVDANRQRTEISTHRLECPSLGEWLQPNVAIQDQGIVDAMVLVLKKDVNYRYDRPEDDPDYGVNCYMGPVRGVTHFNEMVRNQIEEMQQSDYWGPSLFAALLYTDEDFELAKYVRTNYESLDELSGSDCTVFVLESPPQMSFTDTVKYWKDSLAFNVYVLWGSNGWTRTKPYDKAAAYQIGRQMGVLPNQLPCVVFFEQPKDGEKIVIPIQESLTDFFRTLFGSIQEEPESFRGYRWDDQRKSKLMDIKARVEAIGTKISSDTKSVTYNFHGHTVFINRPTGPVQLSDFQNTK